MDIFNMGCSSGKIKSGGGSFNAEKYPIGDVTFLEPLVTRIVVEKKM